MVCTSLQSKKPASSLAKLAPSEQLMEAFLSGSQGESLRREGQEFRKMVEEEMSDWMPRSQKDSGRSRRRA